MCGKSLHDKDNTLCLLSGGSGYYHVVMAEDYQSIVGEMLSPLSPIPTDLSPAGTLPRIPRAILFDVYGTLLISGTGDISLVSLQNESIGLEEILEQSGYPPLLPEDAAENVPVLLEHYIRKAHEELRNSGIDYPEVEIREIWSRVLAAMWGKGLFETEPSVDSIEKLAILHELSVNPVWPMPGFPETVGRIRKKGLSVGIVSNAQFYTPLIMEALTGLSIAETGFQESLCSWSYRLLRAKPSPQVFESPLKILSSSGISPSETLYVGNDMLNDITAASQAGCMTALFAGDRRSLRMRDGDDRVIVKPDVVITELDQLDTIISGGSLNGQA